jgi:flagellar biosynthesis protein FlhA
VIEAFGSFIMQGSFVIGLIVFAILVIVNFVVITKGSGRIAEVSARFSLDAMPGKQMAVDADLSAGLISEEEAKKRRKQLEDESNFFGAMDGAAKFVRGDAIAGLLITFINIVGGIIIGVVQQDMAFSDAMRAYTSLTVGDGLVTQIPALVVSTAAGMLVSKSGVEGSVEKALFNQLSAYPAALGVSAFLMLLLAVAPGLPFIPFFLLAITSAYFAWQIMEKQTKQQEEEDVMVDSTTIDQDSADAEPSDEPIASTLHMDDIRVELGYGLVGLLNTEKGRKLTEQIKNLRRQMAAEIGFVLPSVRIQDNLQLSSNSYLIRVKELEGGRGELQPHQMMVMDPQGEDIQLSGEATTEPTFGLPAMWVGEEQRSQAETRGYTIVDPVTVMTTHLTEIVKDNLAELLSFEDVQKLMDELNDSYKKLLNDIVPSQITVGTVQRVLQNLVAERVSIRDLPTILEGIAEGCGYSRNVNMLTEHVRQRLTRQIPFSNTDSDGILNMVTLSPEWEANFNDALIGDGEVKQLSLAPSLVQEFIEKFQSVFDKANLAGEHIVLVTSPNIRSYVRSMIERVSPSTIIMSQTEVHYKVKMKVVGQI